MQKAIDLYRESLVGDPNNAKTYYDLALALDRQADYRSEREALEKSASLDANNKGLYEPAHGSAPDIAGKNIANPLATILSAAMMLRYTFNEEDAAKRIEAAVKKVLAQGYRTADIYATEMRRVGTGEMGDAVVAAMK